eukprot:c13717_g1_i2.p1 GENE.c13717_g1_i2~~c13717_g1_i2.p1  ORF type:complete len:233 (+),score=40.20 c13717_g1_i2:180-878(+)
MMTEVMGHLESIAKDKETRVLVLAAEGPAFCAGHDLKHLRSLQEKKDDQAVSQVFQTCSQMMLALTRLPQPVIASVSGVATAAGCQLVATCDLAVAATSAKFATPGVNIGLFCSTPSVALSRAVSSKHALEMLFTGKLMDAQRAFEIGLINQIVPPERLSADTLALATHISRFSRCVLSKGKRSFYAQREMTLAGAYDAMSQEMTTGIGRKDANIGIAAFLGKTEPQWSHEE